MTNNDKQKVFKVFDEWILKRGYKWNSKLSKKELWKIFTEEVKNFGIINVFTYEDYNELKKLLSLSYVDENGNIVDGVFTTSEFELENI